jgi:hypothetical protein
MKQSGNVESGPFSAMYVLAVAILAFVIAVLNWAFVKRELAAEIEPLAHMAAALLSGSAGYGWGSIEVTAVWRPLLRLTREDTMQTYDKSVAVIPDIIREAGKNPLGILALLIIVIGALAYFFFGAKLTPKNARLLLTIRVCAFLLVFSGACAFGWTVVRTLPLPAPPAPADEQKEKRLTEHQHGKPTVPQRGATQGSPVPPPPAWGDFRSAVARAVILAGTHNIPGNAAQACEGYAQALHLVYGSLTPSERAILQANESECSQGQSEEHVIVLQGIAREFDARTTSQNQ